MKTVLKFILFGFIFIGLWVAYGYFLEQSLLSSGESRAERVVQSITDGDTSTITTELEEFAGGKSFAQNDTAYQKAVTDIAFIEQLLEEGVEPALTDKRLNNVEDRTLFSAVYSLQNDEQANNSYMVVVLRRDEGEWVLANVYLSALNPLALTGE